MKTRGLNELLSATSHFAMMPDTAGYLKRLDAGLLEKLRIAFAIPKDAKRVLEVGSGTGSMLCVLARLFPDKEFVGIDADAEFVKLANAKAQEEGLTNVTFKHSWLHDMLWPKKHEFDVVIFCSVLHEFFSYGRGIASVTNALGDAHALLSVGGVVIIRDMILDDWTKTAVDLVPTFTKKVLGCKHLERQIAEFTKKYGEFKSLYEFNHFLLKYMYTENWERELGEDYVAVTTDQYKMALPLAGLHIEYLWSYTIPYLEEKWRHDFGLTDEEVAWLVSTTIIVAKKWSDKPYFDSSGIR